VIADGAPVHGIPSDLQSVLTQIEQMDRAADSLVSGLTDTQFYWQPDAGRAWSIAQCLDHLATANRVYGHAIRSAVEAARARGWTRTGPMASNPVGRRFIASLEPPVKRRLKSPSKIRPVSAGGQETIMQLYHEAHAAIRETIVAAAGIDLNRAKFRNPFIPLVRVRVGTGLLVIVAHNRRHLWQAEQVRATRGFPAR
jgi:hypothetical protein